MCDNIIMGGSSYCRYCGHRHSFNDHTDGKVSPLQAKQMELENLEEFIASLYLTINDRLAIMKLFTDFKNELGIPENKIFIERDPRTLPKLFPLDEDALLKKYEAKIKLKPNYSDKSTEIAEKIIEWLYEIPVTAKMQEELLNHIENLRKTE